MRILALAAAVIAAGVSATPAAAAVPKLRAGAGRADITPQTGYTLGGFTRADRRGNGVHTRLHASALVLESGGRKVALVAIDLFAAPGGLVEEIAGRLADRGFSPANVLVSASHTHGGPGGYANFATLNTVAPSAATVTDPFSFYRLLQPEPADRVLYTFLAERITAAIRRADDALAPAVAGWGRGRLEGITRNRSVEAHLADHGVLEEYAAGSADQDPAGAAHTIDREIDVLRVDRVRRRRGRRVPIAAWTMFANHGTVNPSVYQIYHNDHLGIATRVFEAAVRRRARGARIVTVYGNGNEGDQSAGLDGQGPLITERVGRAEAGAFLAAWRGAARRLRRRIVLDVRWTRVCFCGQAVEGGGTVSEQPVAGAPFLTGSEEERGPLYELTGVPFEGLRAPVEGYASHGHKVGLALSPDSYPRAVPLLLVRAGEQAIASLPGEPTVEIGRRVAAAALGPLRDGGVSRVVIAGLTNEFIQYLVTPEEYDRQHYEGASMIYGTWASYALRDQVAELARRMAAGTPAQDAYPFDPRNGVVADGAPYPAGAEAGTITAQPRPTAPGGRVTLDWSGGQLGHDRPVDRPFITVERRLRGGRWRRVADDLGFRIAWTVDDDGGYRARWEPAAAVAAGTYRIRVSANRYALTSEAFEIAPDRPLVEPAPDDAIPYRFTIGP